MFNILNIDETNSWKVFVDCRDITCYIIIKIKLLEKQVINNKKSYNPSINYYL